MKRLCNLMPPRPDRCLLIDAYRPVHDPAGPHQVVRWRWVGDAGGEVETVADSATPTVAESATQKVAHSATWPLADSATPEVAHSATEKGPLPNDGAPGPGLVHESCTQRAGTVLASCVTLESRPSRDARHESHVTQRDGAVTVTRDIRSLSAVCPRDAPGLSQGTAAVHPCAKPSPKTSAKPS